MNVTDNRGAGDLNAALRRLLDNCYEVTLTSGGSDDSYWARVQLGGGPLYTAEGRTPMEAVWNASPLHDDAEPMPAPVVRMTVTGDCGHVLGTWDGKIEEKYPFWCEQCGEDKRSGRYPWTITADIVGSPVAAPAASPFPDPCGDVVCRHGRDSHWEHAEPDGPRKGCAILGCPCMAYMAVTRDGAR